MDLSQFVEKVLVDIIQGIRGAQKSGKTVAVGKVNPANPQVTKIDFDIALTVESASEEIGRASCRERV